MNINHVRLSLLAVLAFALVPRQALAQVSSSDPNVQVALKTAADAGAQQLQANPPGDVWGQIDAHLSNAALVGFVAAHYAIPSKASLFLKAAATTQTKQQNGAVPNATASTSLVQKPLAETLLNIGLENGAVLDDVNGDNLTLSSSPYAMIAAFAGDNDTTYRNYGSFARLGLNGSFRISDSSDALSSVNGSQLSNTGVTFRLTKDHSARSKDAMAVFQGMLKSEQGQAVTSAGSLRARLRDNDVAWRSALINFRNDAEPKIQAALAGEAGKSQADVSADFLAILKTAFDADMAASLNSDDFRPDAEVRTFLSLYPSYIQAIGAFQTSLTNLNKKSVGSAFYNYQVPRDATAYHEVGASYAGSPSDKMDLTYNASVSLYPKNNAAMNQSTFRGASGSFELNLKVRRSPFVKDPADQSPVTVAISGRYQRIQENQHVADKKADIGEGNFKLTIPLAGGLSLPFSATFANAGQTIKETYVRGNFGLTFDLDKLSALLKN